MHYLDSSVVDLLISGFVNMVRILRELVPSFTAESLRNFLHQPLAIGIVIGILISFLLKGLMRLIMFVVVLALLSGIVMQGRMPLEPFL